MVYASVQVGLHTGVHHQLPPIFPDAAKHGLHHFFGLDLILQYGGGIGLQLAVPAGKQGVKGVFIACFYLFYYDEFAGFQFAGLKCPEISGSVIRRTKKVLPYGVRKNLLILIIFV